jgi:ankyrin repeat protein
MATLVTETLSNQIDRLVKAGKQTEVINLLENVSIIDNVPLLLWALKQNYGFIVDYLFQCNRFDVSETDDDGKTALHYACMCNNYYDANRKKDWSPTKFGFVKQLINMGLDINQTSKERNLSPIHIILNSFAVGAEVNDLSYSIFKYMVKQPTININIITNNGNMTPLMRTCELNDPKLVECLLTKTDISLDMENINGQTALILACEKYSTQTITTCRNTYNIIWALLNKNCKIDVSDNKSMSPLHYTMLRSSHSDLNDTLICHVQNIDSRDNTGKTALHYASSHAYGNTRTIDNLVKYGADIHSTDNDGNNALHHAVKYKNKTYIYHLLNKYHCDILLENNENQTPLDIFNQITNNSDNLTNSGNEVREFLKTKFDSEQYSRSLHGIKRALISTESSDENEPDDDGYMQHGLKKAHISTGLNDIT